MVLLVILCSLFYVDTFPYRYITCDYVLVYNSSFLVHIYPKKKVLQDNSCVQKEDILQKTLSGDDLVLYVLSKKVSSQAKVESIVYTW